MNETVTRGLIKKLFSKSGQAKVPVLYNHSTTSFEVTCGWLQVQEVETAICLMKYKPNVNTMCQAVARPFTNALTQLSFCWYSQPNTTAFKANRKNVLLVNLVQSERTSANARQ